MEESRISILLKNSRSRHELIDNPYLKRASIQNFKAKKQRIETEKEHKKIVSQVKYYESLNRRLLSKVQKERISLYYVAQNRKRIQRDFLRKKHLEDLRRKDIMHNQQIAEKIRNQRLERQEAVRLSKMQKSSQGILARSTKTRLMSQKYEKQLQQYQQNKNRVESILQFECNLRESYVREKQQNNQKYLKSYKQSIMNNKRRILSKKQQTLSAKQRLKSLTSEASNHLNQLHQLSKSIHEYKTSRKVSLSPLSFNKQKLIMNSRCLTHENKSQINNNSTDNSLFFSHNKTEN